VIRTHYSIISYYHTLLPYYRSVLD